MRARFSILTLGCLLSACAMPVADQAPVAYARPADVKVLFNRAAGCQHWAGEEAYDSARAKEILQAVHRLRCETLDNDYTRLRRKYAANAAVIQDMDTTNQNYGFEFLQPAR